MAKKKTKKAKTTTKAKVATTKAILPIRAVSKARTKSEIFTGLADNTGLARKQISTLFESLTKMISMDVAKGPKIFTVPGLMKITSVHKPATKARKGINPFTGQEMMFKAKPARNVIKVRALKGLKKMV